MISGLDKAILGTVGVSLTGGAVAASLYAWSMMHADGSLPFTTPAAVVAELAGADGSVRTRHRETLAWTSGERRQPLREGDRIRTLSGAHATVRYAQGLEVTLDPNSQITVHGPSDANGDPLVGAIDVVDGSIHAKVSGGASVALRDAAGHEQGRIKASTGSAELNLTAPEQADGNVGVKVTEGSHVEVAVQAKDGEHTRVLSQGEESHLGEIAATPTPTQVAIATSTPIPPLEPGELPDIITEGGDVRFRLKIPPGVTEVLVRGKPAVLHADGTVEVALFGLPVGVNVVELVYRHKDGRITRQPQKIKVRSVN